MEKEGRRIMARKLLILGQTGTGKTHSLKGFTNDDVTVLSVHKPELSFRSNIQVKRTPNAKSIIKEMKASDKKVIVVDDFQYLLGVATMRRSLEKGWDKFSEIQKDYFDVLDAVDELPDDVIVVFMSHTDKSEDGDVTIKTVGKALDRYITIEGLFTIVLGTQVTDGQYYFITQNNGKNTLKSPEGMFPSYAIDNDLPYVIDKIRNYYYMDNAKSDEEMQEADERVSSDLKKPDSKGRRARNTSADTEPKRRSREDVQKDNKAKADAHIAEMASAVDAVAGDQEEVPFEEAMNAAEKVDEPTMEPLPRAIRDGATEPTQQPTVRRRRTR